MRKLIFFIPLIAVLGIAANASGLAPLAKTSWITTCTFSHESMDDPIVYPGQPGASHDHTFAGSSTTDAYSTFDSLRAGGTSCKMPADHSGYWVPTANYPLHPKLGTLWYYAATQQSRPFPDGLKMIVRYSGGNVAFKCGPGASLTKGTAPPASCTSGMLVAIVDFPRYWDGVNTDSPDHLSHMSYTQDAAHPVELPQIRGFIRYAVPAGQPINLQLSSGDYTTWHVDFFDGWDPAELQRFITKCGGLSCGQNPS